LRDSDKKMSSTLINGKHYKQVVIEYYDDLIAQLDVHAEITLDKFKDDNAFNKSHGQKMLKPRQLFYNSLGFFFEKEFEPFKDPLSFKYRFNDELVASNAHSDIVFQDFVHAERMRGVNEMKKLQRERLEELKVAKTKPTTIEEALFGENKFGFLVEIGENQFEEIPLKFRVLAVVVDFYLDKVQIENIK
jgi:hypothetical protein